MAVAVAARPAPAAAGAPIADLVGGAAGGAVGALPRIAGSGVLLLLLLLLRRLLTALLLPLARRAARSSSCCYSCFPVQACCWFDKVAPDRRSASQPACLVCVGGLLLLVQLLKGAEGKKNPENKTEAIKVTYRSDEGFLCVLPRSQLAQSKTQGLAAVSVV